MDKKWENKIEKVTKVINSCVTKDQLINAYSYADLFIKDFYKHHPNLSMYFTNIRYIDFLIITKASSLNIDCFWITRIREP